MMDDFSKLQITDTTTLAWQIRASSAFEHWVKQSNGKIDIRQYKLSSAIEAFDLYKPEFLAKLKFEPFKGALPDSVTLSEDLTPDDFHQQFRSDAAFGGAYSDRPAAKTWDKAVWTSIANLMDVSVHQPLDKLKKQMGRFYWYQVTVDSEWFYQVAWDCCYMCLDMAGQQLNIIAVSDTD